MVTRKRTDIKKADFMIVRQNTNDHIVKITVPQHFEVGLDDPEFLKRFFVHGTIGSTNGITGSITQLPNGKPYIRQGTNVQVVTGADGSITVSAVNGAGGATLNALSAGGITPFTYTGASAASISLDLFSSTGLNIDATHGLEIDPTQANELAATPASNDVLLIHDTSDVSNIRSVKKITVANLMAAASFGTLANPLTMGSGLALDSGNPSYNNSASETIKVDLATNSGLGFDSSTPSKLKITLDGSTLSLGTGGLSVSSVPNALSSGTGIASLTYDGSGTGTVAIDTSVVPQLGAATNTFTGNITVGGNLQTTVLHGGNGSDLIIGGSNVSISKDGTYGTLTINAALGSGAALSQGNGIAAFSYDGSSSATVAASGDSSRGISVNASGIGIDATSLSTSASRTSSIIVTDGGTTITQDTVGNIVDMVDRTAIMSEGNGIDITFQSIANPAIIAVKGDGSTISVGSGGVSVNKVPHALSAGQGVQTFSYDGSATKTVTLNLAAGDNISLTNESDGSITIAASTAGGLTSGSISNVTQANPGVVTTIGSHGLSESQPLTITDVVGMTELNGNRYFANVLTSNTFSLFSDAQLTTSVDTSAFTAYGSNGKYTGEATSASLSVVSGSTTVNAVDKFDISRLGVLQSLGSGDIAITGSIGFPEDGSYIDGLFTDFNSTTPVGTAVDRFNEVLKGLAPGAAPSLDDIDCSDSGVSAKLSFGSSQSITGYTNVQPSTLSPASGLSNVDINGTFSSTIVSNDVRAAVFDGSTVIDGTLNADISADGVNYNAASFGNGNQGTLKLFVNDNSTPIHSVDLSSFGSGNSLNSDGSGFNLTATTPGHFADGSNFETFQHRQGTYTIVAASQRNGWNYARVVHTIGSSDTTCNYVEWVNDPDANAMSSDNSAMDGLSMTGTKQLTGVIYNTGGSAQYRIRAVNVYRDVYSTSNVTFNGTNCSVPAQAIPDINYGAGENETKMLNITGSATITGDPILNGSITVSTNVPHPLKTNLSSAGSQSISGILLYNLSDTSTATSETFRGESYRLLSGSYGNQSDITSGNYWDSTVDITGGTSGYQDAMIFYNSRLYAPVQGGVSGDFRNTSDGGSISNGPSSNVNYSTLTTGLKTFYRYFTNTSGGSKSNFALTINGSGTIVSQLTSLSTSNIHVMIKLPQTSDPFSTGWMDLAVSFATGQVGDGAGCLVGSLNSSLNAENNATFGTQSVGANEYIVVKIEADASWTGYISTMSISWS